MLKKFLNRLNKREEKEAKKQEMLNRINELNSEVNKVKSEYFTTSEKEISQDDINIIREYAKIKDPNTHFGYRYIDDEQKFMSQIMDVNDKIFLLRLELTSHKPYDKFISRPNKSDKEFVDHWRQHLDQLSKPLFKEIDTYNRALLELKNGQDISQENKKILFDAWKNIKRLKPELENLPKPEATSSSINKSELSKDSRIRNLVEAQVSTSAKTKNSDDPDIITKASLVDTNNIFVTGCSDLVELFSTAVSSYPTIYSIILTVIRIMLMMYCIEKKDHFYRYELLKLTIMKQLKKFKNSLVKKLKFF